MSDFTQEQLTALNQAIAAGTLKVKYTDKEVTYRSLDEMIKLRNLIKADLGLTDRGPLRVHVNTRKGL